MTGTAMTEAERVLEDLQARRDRHSDQQAAAARINYPDVIYRTEQEKWRRRSIERRSSRRSHDKTSRPADPRIGTDATSDARSRASSRGRCSVGTVSIEAANVCSNAQAPGAQRQASQREAEIVAQAGRNGAVTIATNMAGRGTDIILGGNPETMAWAQLQGQVRHAARRARRTSGTTWSTRSKQREQMKAEGREVAEHGRPAHHRHRAARSPPHRPPASRPLRPPGRSRLAAASTSRWKTT